MKRPQSVLANAMKLNQAPILQTCPEAGIYESLLTLDHQNILELGCGDASLTRKIASSGVGRQITAAEVDADQHEKNQLIKNLTNVEFIFAGAENIPLADASFDTVFMFKSLHHVPESALDQTLLEIARVLKPGGLAYISEPVFAGDLNEVLRIFHDEEKVRHAAFAALERAVGQNLLSLQQELFFNLPRKFENFQQYHDQHIAVSYNRYQIGDELLAKIEWKFDQYFAQNAGEFVSPIRVDLLQKPQM